MRPHIENMKHPTVEQLQHAAAMLERDFYSENTSASNRQAIETANGKITDLQNQVTLLAATSTWPGFGTDALHAMRGDYKDPALKIFSKSGSQAADVGDHPILFDTTVPFSSIPVVFVWTIDTSPFGLSPRIATSITTTGFTVNIDVPGTIYYYAIGLR
jgi:hypothetical protein